MSTPHFHPSLTAIVCACLGMGLVACNEDNQPGTAPSEINPALAATAAPLFRVATTGWNHSYAISQENLAYCWGNNARGQLGTGDRVRRFTATPVKGGLLFENMDAGVRNTCGAGDDDKAYCWGENLPSGTWTQPKLVDETLRFVQVTTGFNHFCGITPEGKAYCRGENTDGQLGDGSTLDRATAVPVAGTRNYRQISTSDYHTCAVTRGDRAFCWGDNSVGQLGDGNTGGGSTSIHQLRPTAVAGGLEFRQITAGGAFTCALTTDDLAYCWGVNRDGQLGDETLVDRPTPAPVHGGKRFLQIQAGENQVCGVTLDHRGFCWGRGGEGQLGNGAFESISHGMKPQLVRGGLIWSLMAAGGLHSCGVTTAGVAYCWGKNDQGQLGDGTQVSRSRPVAVLGPS